MSKFTGKLKLMLLIAAVLTFICAGTVLADDFKAEVIANGDTIGYDSFETAWAMACKIAKGGDEVTFKLLSDWNGYGDMGSGDGFDYGRLYVSTSGAMIIDLNGHTLSRNLRSIKDHGAVIVVGDKCKLTIKDSDPDSYNYSSAIAGGVITGGWSDNCAGLIEVYGGELIMTGGSLVNGVSNEEGGAIRAKDVSNTTISLTNVRFVGNSTQNSKLNCHGGAIYFKATEGSALILNNCSFEDNYSEDNGGAIYLDGYVSLTANDTSFTGNSCQDHGGAVYSDALRSALYKNCTFYNNHADDDGGAVYTNKDGTTEFYDTEMIYNSAGDEGGAWYINAWKTFMYDVRIEYNTSVGKGGGVYVDSYYDTNLQGLMIIRNNTSNKEARTSNLFLQTGLGDSTQARFGNGGCEPGSEVHYGTDNNGASRVCDSMTEYQLQYFHTDEKSQELAYTTTSNEAYSVASIFADGTLWIIIAGGVLICAAIALAVFFGLKRRKQQDEK